MSELDVEMLCTAAGPKSFHDGSGGWNTRRSCSGDRNKNHCNGQSDDTNINF